MQINLDNRFLKKLFKYGVWYLVGSTLVFLIFAFYVWVIIFQTEARIDTRAEQMHLEVEQKLRDAEEFSFVFERSFIQNDRLTKIQEFQKQYIDFRSKISSAEEYLAENAQKRIALKDSEQNLDQLNKLSESDQHETEVIAYYQKKLTALESQPIDQMIGEYSQPDEYKLRNKILDLQYDIEWADRQLKRNAEVRTDLLENPIHKKSFMPLADIERHWRLNRLSFEDDFATRVKLEAQQKLKDLEKLPSI